MDGTVEPWIWECDQIALSPRTARLATWCSPTDDGSTYAVIEWGGQIWYSQDAPIDSLLQRRLTAPFTAWSWSPDGEYLAYFDPLDPVLSLLVVTSTGEERHRFLGMGQWLLSYPFAPLRSIIQWSSDSRRILTLGSPGNSQACRHLEASELLYCWQLLDLSSNDVQWSVSDSAVALMGSSDELARWSFLSAALDRSGEKVAFTTRLDTLYEILLLDVSNNQLIGGWDIRGVGFHLRWGETVEAP
jgi:hypothetical protein